MSRPKRMKAKPVPAQYTEKKVSIFAAYPSPCGGPIELHVYGEGKFALHWGVSGEWKGSAEEADKLISDIGHRFAEHGGLVRSDRWTDTCTSHYGHGLGGVLT